MPKQIFINLPVKNLERSMAFFRKLGFEFNPQFTDDKAACMIISDDHSYAMLLTDSYFQTFTPKPVADASRSTEVLTALSLDSRAAVDRMVEAAIAAGGSEARPAQDLGFMYNRSINDPDGHIWEIFHMNMEAMPKE